jgi:hypothetical protein
LSLAYTWTPTEINHLTIFQAAMYLSDTISERGTIRLKLDEFARRRGNGKLFRQD